MNDETVDCDNEMIIGKTTNGLNYILDKYCELINSIDETKSEYRKSLNNQYYTLMSEIYFTRGILWLFIGAIMFSGVSGFVDIGFGIFNVFLAIGYFVESYCCRKKVI